MKFLFDFFPVVAFFIAYYIPDDLSERMFLATGVAIIAVIIQVAAYWIVKHRVEKMHIITLAVILILGGATLLTRDKHFFMWKPTVVNWLFAVVFLGSQFIGKKPIIQRMLEHALSVPDRIWMNLNLSWVLFFTFLGGINIYVAYNFAEHIWVNFKLFGMLGLTLLFAVGQAIYMSRHMMEVENTEE